MTRSSCSRTEPIESLGSAAVTDRAEMMLRGIDVARSHGLEIGPLAKPIVRRDMGPIRYLDHVGTDELRQRYASHDHFDLDAIVDIDHASAGRSIEVTVGPDAPFDYVIASHVIEHVPDLIGWLHDIRAVLRDGAVLSLAIPDHRRCFDALRSPTVVADLVQAHLAGASTPSPRQVFDHYSSAVTWHGYIAWEEEPPFAELVPVHSEGEALERATRASTINDYQDVHCWVFTPSSFARVMASLQRLQLSPMWLEHCSETIGGEFFAMLRASDPPEAPAPEQVLALPRGLPATASEHAVLRADLERTRAELQTARTELDATTASRSWRLTRPLRALNNARFRRR